MSSYSVLNTGSGKKHTHTVRRLQWSYRFYILFPNSEHFLCSIRSHRAYRTALAKSYLKFLRRKQRKVTTI